MPYCVPCVVQSQRGLGLPVVLFPVFTQEKTQMEWDIGNICVIVPDEMHMTFLCRFNKVLESRTKLPS